MTSKPLAIIHLNQPKPETSPPHLQKQLQLPSPIETKSHKCPTPPSSPQSSISCYLMRHAESEYNQISHNCQYPCLSPQAKNLYQIDPTLIDCQITEKGVAEILSTTFTPPPKTPVQSSQNNAQDKCQDETIMFDCVYISPLNRVLQTAKLLLDHGKIRCKKIVVVPELTEVVSKICDFGGGMAGKVDKYGGCFDFGLCKGEQSGNQNGQQAEFWQDSMIDADLHPKIIKTVPTGQRYLQILQQIFPNPLQSPEQCLKRSLRALNRIKALSKKQGNKNILIISHNRILKNILTKGQNLQTFQILKNCQIRHIDVHVDVDVDVDVTGDVDVDVGK